MLSEYRNEILKEYGFHLKRHAPPENGNLELEAKFGTIKEGKFLNEIPFVYFDRLRTAMSRVSPPIITKTTDQMSSDDVRKTTTVIEAPKSTEAPKATELSTELETSKATTELGATAEKVTWMKKTRLWNKESLNFGVKLSLSLESKLTAEPKGWVPTSLRDKTRYSYILNSGKFRLDLTEVDQTIFKGSQVRGGRESKVGVTSNRFEIELELLDTTALEEFFLQLNEVFRLVYATEEIWTFPERDTLISYTNQLLQGNDKLPVIDISRIRQPRNLRWDDIVYGGIVGNPEEKYVIYHKVDGFRKLLVCAPSGVWIVYPQYEFNKLTSEVMDLTIGSILFVEEVPPENRKLQYPNTPKANYWLLVFDCVSYAGDFSVADLTLDKRSEFAQKITDRLQEQFEDTLLAIGTSKYRVIRNPDEFFSHCREFLNEEDNLEYQTDGLIFAPMIAKAQHHSDKKPLDQRVLTRFPDSCKWKPQHLLTNDLAIRWRLGSEVEGFESLIGLKILDVDSYIVEDRLFPKSEYGTVSLQKAIINNNPSGSFIKFRWNVYQNFLEPIALAKRALNYDEAKRRLDRARDPEIPIGQRKQIVMDFKIQKGSTVELYATWQKFVPFRGTEEYEFNPAYIYPGEVELDNLPTGTVVEFQTTELGIRPLRIRHDKTLPNRLDVALDNWTLSKNPISRATMLGETFDLLERYKERALLRLLDTISNVRKVLIIGDFPHVNPEILSKFQSVTLIQPQAGGQEFKDLKNVKALKQTIGPNILAGITESYDAIVFYQSLSQIFSRPILEGLVRLLPQNGILAYVDLDTDAVKHLFFPEIRGPEPNQTGITIGPIQLKWIEGAVMPIQITSTDPNKKGLKTEGRTEVSLFTFLESGFQIMDPSGRLDEELMMHQAERFFGDIHSGIILRRYSLEYKMPPIEQVTLPLHVGEKIPSDQPPDQKAIQKSLEDGYLPMLPVILPFEIRPAENVPIGERSVIPRGRVAAGDDTYEVVNCTWYPGQVVRIATIGDGSCFFHAVLKGYDPVYQNNNEAAFRLELVSNLRRDLAAALELEDPKNPGKSYYETAANGQFVTMADQQRLNPALITQLKVDFTLKGLQALLNSDMDIGDEIYQYVSEMLGVDVYVLRGTRNDLWPHLNTSRQGQMKASVVIMGNMNHYEVIGLSTNEGFQTLFISDHPFLVALRQKFLDEQGYK